MSLIYMHCRLKPETLETHCRADQAGHPKDEFIVPPIYIGILDTLVSLRDTAKYQADLDKVLARTVRP